MNLQDGYTRTPHKKRREGRKPFTIEWRASPECGFKAIPSLSDWSVYSRYRSRTSRDTALQDLQGKHDQLFEFRSGGE